MEGYTKVELDRARARFDVLRPFLEDGAPLTRIAQEHRIGLRTARRWVQQYRVAGLLGLVRKRRIDRGSHRLPRELHCLIVDLVTRHPSPTIAHIHRQVAAAAHEHAWPAPSYAYVRSIIRGLRDRTSREEYAAVVRGKDGA